MKNLSLALSDLHKAECRFLQAARWTYVSESDTWFSANGEHQLPHDEAVAQVKRIWKAKEAS
jgi:hypothetical protein